MFSGHDRQSAGLFSLCFFVCSSANLKNFFLSFRYSSASSARKGCSGSGSLTKATSAWITAQKHFRLEPANSQHSPGTLGFWKKKIPTSSCIAGSCWLWSADYPKKRPPHLLGKLFFGGSKLPQISQYFALFLKKNAFLGKIYRHRHEKTYVSNYAFSLYCINESIESKHITLKSSNNTLLAMKSELHTKEFL